MKKMFFVALFLVAGCGTGVPIGLPVSVPDAVSEACVYCTQTERELMINLVQTGKNLGGVRDQIEATLLDGCEMVYGTSLTQIENCSVCWSAIVDAVYAE